MIHDYCIVPCLVNQCLFLYFYFLGDPQTPTSNDGKISLSSVFYLLDMNIWQTSLRKLVKKINRIFQPIIINKRYFFQQALYSLKLENSINFFIPPLSLILLFRGEKLSFCWKLEVLKIII